MNGVALNGAIEGYKTVNNLSTDNQLLLAIQAGVPYVLLGDAHTTASLDFEASTVAISTQCTPFSQTCNLNFESEASTPFNCPNGLSGDLSSGTPVNGYLFSNSNFYVRFYNDSTLRQEANYYQPTNPLYFLIIASVAADWNGSISNDEVIETQIGSGFIVACEATVYNVSYFWLNGSVADISSVSPVNTTTAGIIGGPMIALLGSSLAGTGYAQMSTAASIAILANTSQGLADEMALAFSQTSLGFAAGVFSPRLNVQEQVRETFLVSRVLQSSLYLLVVLNCLYAVVALVFAVVAIVSNLRDKGVREIDIRLTILGVVARAFEKPIRGHGTEKVEQLYEERLHGSTNVIFAERRGQGWNFEQFRSLS